MRSPSNAAPTIDVDINAGEKLMAGEDRVITVRVKDKNLSDAAIYLDGGLVEARQTVVTASRAEILRVEGADLVAPREKVTASNEEAPVGEEDSPNATVPDPLDELEAPAPAPEGEGSTVLSFEVGPDFEVGEHELIVTANDKARNFTDVAVTFEVLAPDPVEDKDDPDNAVMIPGIESGDLIDPNQPDGWTEWVSGRVGKTDGPSAISADGSADQKNEGATNASGKKVTAEGTSKLSYTGATVLGLAALAAVLVVVGLVLRKRTNAS